MDPLILIPVFAVIAILSWLAVENNAWSAIEKAKSDGHSDIEIAGWIAFQLCLCAGAFYAVWLMPTFLGVLGYFVVAIVILAIDNWQITLAILFLWVLFGGSLDS